MVKQTIGFSWGPAGLGCSLWTGVPLRALLHASGITEPSATAQHVCFCGPLRELPKGEDGSYGTSIPLHMALDPACDVMVAFEQNGERLHPDHGFPLRLVIPGWIGGRMVKWLSEVCVTAMPSSNHYHFNDNRILPPEVDAERAAAEDWWSRPQYIFNELNLNSAIRSPAHGEELLLQRAANMQPYTLGGYSYSGGGREVTRVEVSVDEGLGWQLTTLTHPWAPTRYGRHWCWTLWELTIDARALLLCSTLRVRAWDSANNTQPRDITWNVMVRPLCAAAQATSDTRSQGMGNSCHFTVRVQQSVDADGGVRLRFEHPTEPGALKGGWMGNAAGGCKPTLAGAPTAPPIIAAAPSPPLPPSPPLAAAAVSCAVAEQPLAAGVRTFTMAEVSKHCTEADCWIVVGGKVYDTTACASFSEALPCKLLTPCSRAVNKLHPGGGSSIFINAGSDTTEEFEAIHSKRAWEQLAQWYVGELATAPAEDAAAPPPPPATPPPPSAPAVRDWGGPVALDARRRQPFTLTARRDAGRNSVLLRFALPSPQHVLGLPLGQHLYLAARVGEKLVMRAYTPTAYGPGYFDVLVKVYRPAPAFPAGGLLSQHLASLQPGECCEAKGPTGHIQYLAGGVFSVHALLQRCSHVAAVAGGSGITPLYQLLVAALGDPRDETRWALLYANREEEDILLRGELEELAAAHPGRFSLQLMLSRPPPAWAGLRGRVSEAALHATLTLTAGAPAAEGVGLLCGPEGMQDASAALLRELGYERVYTF